jgi:hypothetical protein
MHQSDPVRPPEPAASGTLAKKPLAHLLVYALDRRLTGTFEVTGANQSAARVYVAEGLVSRVWTSEPVTYLGHVLYELGTIDDTTLSLSLAQVAATKKLHGQILLEQSLVDEPRLDEGLRQQRARKLQHAFTFAPESSFAFYADVDLVGARPNDPEPIDPLPAIWHGVRLYPSWDHVRATIARVAGRPIRLGMEVALDRLGLDKNERAAAECLRLKASTIPELAIIGGLTIQATDLLAYFLVITKQVEVVDRSLAVSSLPPTGASVPPKAAAAVSAPPPEVGLPSVRPMRVSATGKPFSSGEYVRKISFQMRAVTEDATAIRIPSPVPDRVPSPMPGRIASPMPGRLTPPTPPTETLPTGDRTSGVHPSNAPRMATPPGRMPSVAPERMPSAAPGRMPSGAPARSMTPPPGSVRAAAMGPASEPPRSNPTLPPAADLARKKSIVDRAKWIDQEDYFKMLMISREATTDDVRAAFLRAAKVWHPDTLPESVSDARADSEKVFRKITTAYETLVEPARRRAYERTLDAAMKESAEAAQFLSQADMHLTLGDREEAEELARKALVAAPGHPEATALLAYLEAMDPRMRSAEHTNAQIKMLEMAIAKDPMCRRAHYFRAILYKKVENHDDAIKDLRVAVTNDPDDREAQRELRIYEQKLREGIIQLRSMSPFPKKEKGFLDRILSKK